LNSSDASLHRRFIKAAILFSILHFCGALIIGGLIFLAAHLPPKAVNLDSVILMLANFEDVLLAPRKLFLQGWPGETTPRFLGVLATILNSAAWGCALAGVRLVWRRLTAR
jgi:hypothetical protein